VPRQGESVIAEHSEMCTPIDQGKGRLQPLKETSVFLP